MQKPWGDATDPTFADSGDCGMDLQSETPQTSANHEDLRILADIFREMVVDGDMKNTLILIKTSLIHSTNNTSAVTE